MTQPKLISTPKSNILVIGGIPEDVSNYEILRDSFIKLPSGNWQILGKLSEITEEQASITIQPTEYHESHITPLYLLLELLNSHGVYADNPYEKPYKGDYMTDGVVTISDAQSDSYYADLKRYEDAQRFTNPLILIEAK